MEKAHIIKEENNFYRIVELRALRRTPGVHFDYVPMDFLPRIDAIDRVIHDGGAVSPGPIDDVERPWYMHLYQDDNLIVMHGKREVDIYRPEYGRIEHFTVTPNGIWQNGELIVEGAAMLVWPRGVFHRIVSSDAEGSASLNFAVHYEGFNIKTNFSIYKLDTETGAYEVIREGHRDQPCDA